jgi:hypothetical protein
VLSVPEQELLNALSADALPMLEAVGVPAYVVDRHRRVRWQNAASIELVEDLRGRLDGTVLAPEDLPRWNCPWLVATGHVCASPSALFRSGTRAAP